MKVRLLSVGKPRDRTLATLHDRYAERIRRLRVRYEAGWVPEVSPRASRSEDLVRQREAATLLEALEPRGTVIALDRRGELVTSERLAERLESWATPLSAFVIGGPLGLHEELLGRAHRLWSLSPLTFPHELVRVLVAEQIYRALTLLRRVPYHK